MENEGQHNPVPNEGAEPPSPIRPNVKAGNERILGKPSTPESAQEKDDNIELTRELIRVEKGQLRINAFLAVITAVAVCVAIFSAIKSIQLTRQTSHLDQRAWVATTGVTETHEVGKPVVSTVMIKNSGRTFAKKVCIDGHRRARLKGTEPDLDNTPSSEPKSIGLVAPDTEYGSIGIGGRDTHEEDFEQVKNGDVRIFLFGKITYEECVQMSALDKLLLGLESDQSRPRKVDLGCLHSW